MAEDTGFEPADPLKSTVFKAAAFYCSVILYIEVELSKMANLTYLNHTNNVSLNDQQLQLLYIRRYFLELHQ